MAQAWQLALEAEQAEPGGLEALIAHGEAALQEALVRKARRLPQAGDDLFLEASDHFARAHEIAPDRVEPLDGLCLALWYQGRFAEAAQAHYEQDGDAAGALDAYGHVLTLVPADEIALERVVSLALRLDLREQAIRALELARVHNPDSPTTARLEALLSTQD